MRWTQALMRDVAQEERAGLGLCATDPFDPYALAQEHGIDVYTLENESHRLVRRRSNTSLAITCWSIPSTA